MVNQVQTSSHPQSGWTAVQAYTFAVFCLALGVTLGYLFRGSASPAEQTVAASQVSNGNATQGAGEAQVDPAQQKEVLDHALAPILAGLQSNSQDFDATVKVANLYYDARQYPDAIKYYQLALKIQPQNADVRTDLGTSLWYTGDADAAIVEFQQALKFEPGRESTLFNLGVVRWQGKKDPNGAVQAWEELLQRNPNSAQKQQIEDFIAKAKQHAKG